MNQKEYEERLAEHLTKKISSCITEIGAKQVPIILNYVIKKEIERFNKEYKQPQRDYEKGYEL